MAGDTLSVKVSADTTLLQAKLAVASASLKTFSADVRHLAADYRSAGDDAKGSILASLEQSIVKANQARASMTALSTSLGAGGIKAGLESIGLNAREATTGLARMGEELARGNVVAAAPHIAMLALRLGSVSTGFLAAAVGVGAFGAAIAYGVTEAARMEAAIGHIADLAASMGESGTFGPEKAQAAMSVLIEKFGLGGLRSREIRSRPSNGRRGQRGAER